MAQDGVHISEISKIFTMAKPNFHSCISRTPRAPCDATLQSHRATFFFSLFFFCLLIQHAQADIQRDYSLFKCTKDDGLLQLSIPNASVAEDGIIAKESC